MPHPAVSTGVDAQAIQSWPSAVGMDAQAAKEMIQQQAPGKTVLLVPAGSIVTMVGDGGRVRASPVRLARCPVPLFCLFLS